MKQEKSLIVKVTPYCSDIQKYLECTPFLNYDYPAIQELANQLMNQATQLVQQKTLSKATMSQTEDQADVTIAYMEAAFTFVRDSIKHSADVGEMEITRSASEVLEAGHGICFAKSHLLVALLRAKRIPAGLCYQRLTLSEEDQKTLIYHGLCGVYLETEDRWIRLDARGNKEGVDAQFSTTIEKLAFPIRPELGEEDIFLVYPEPDKDVVRVLTENETREQLWKNLPITLAYRDNLT